MPNKTLIVVVTLNAVLSQLVLRYALKPIGRLEGLSDVPRFIAGVVSAPWVYASLALQVLGYVLWMILISREQLGVATASVGAGFYLLMALSAWMIYGEALTPVQWFGIVFVTFGVVCISLGPV
jgi:drug/metabolite transporter (DMT)-like permease